MPGTPKPKFWLKAVRREVTDTQALAAGASPEQLSAPVPSCPGWTLADLLGHLGEIYDYAAAAVSGAPSQPPVGTRPDAPSDPAAAVAFYQQKSAQLLTVLDAADPKAEAWNWSTAPNIVAFWFRRMAHESAIHRWDAQLTLGTPEPIESKLAADGVAEVLDFWVAHKAKQVPLHTGVVRLSATDENQQWSLRLREVGLSQLDTDTVLDPGPGAQAKVDASASDLNLAMWGRISFAVLEAQGDMELLSSLQVG